MRKPIFDIIRAQRGKGFTSAEVKMIDELLDQLKVDKDDDEVSAPAPAPKPAQIGKIGLDDAPKFFDAVRKSGVIGSVLKPDQVSGLEAVLAAATEAKWPLAHAAYALATAAHETNFTMQPVREAYWLSENWRRNNLRYFPYYGRGYVQLTWKANYEKADRELDLKGALKANLDLAMDPVIAAGIMAKGMTEGWFCADKSGKRHTLTRHLPTNGKASSSQFTAARRIINGTDKAPKIAAEAVKFQDALLAGGW